MSASDPGLDEVPSGADAVTGMSRKTVILAVALAVVLTGVLCGLIALATRYALAKKRQNQLIPDQDRSKNGRQFFADNMSFGFNSVRSKFGPPEFDDIDDQDSRSVSTISS